MKKVDYVYVTRASFSSFIRIWPANVGIRKFHGCVMYGAAWDDEECNYRLTPNGERVVKSVYNYEFLEAHGWCPKPGEAWFVDGKKHTKVDLEFTS